MADETTGEAVDTLREGFEPERYGKDDPESTFISAIKFGKCEDGTRDATGRDEKSTSSSSSASVEISADFESRTVAATVAANPKSAAPLGVTPGGFAFVGVMVGLTIGDADGGLIVGLTTGDTEAGLSAGLTIGDTGAGLTVGVTTSG